MRICNREYRWERPKFFFVLISLVAVVTLLSLSAWQLHRLEWKLGLIQQIEKANVGAPLNELPSDPEKLKALTYYRVTVHGTFQHEKELHVAARYYQRKLGYHVLTPMVLDDNRVVIVNRGWVPDAMREQEKRPESIKVKNATITGMIREASPPMPWYMPGSDPQKNVWFGYDLPAMQQHLGEPILPVVIETLGEPTPGVYPVPLSGEVRLRNDHLGYAMTWFGLAIVWTGMFIIYHLRRVRDAAA